MLIKIENIISIKKYLNKIFDYLNLAGIVFLPYGFFSNSNILNVIIALLLLLIIFIFSKKTAFQKSPFSIVFIFFTLFFISIPVIFQVLMGDSYLIGGSVGELIYENSTYYDSRWLSYLFLILCWISIWLGLQSTISIKPVKYNFKNVSNLEIKVLLLSLFVVICSYLNILDTNMVRTGEKEFQTFSLLSFLFNDTAFLLMSSIAIFEKISSADTKNILSKNIYILIFVFFIFVQITATSKGAIFSVLTFFYIIPLCVLQTKSNGKAVNFQLSSFIVILIISPIIYFISINSRLSFHGNQNVDFFAFDLFNLLIRICYRFSWGGMDQFLLIFYNEIDKPHNFQMSYELLIYVIKNFINLLLPGTYFTEAYYPSSQMFSNVINNIPLISEYNRTGIVLSSNTQPFTIFGFFIIFFGLFSPFFLYLFTLIIKIVYSFFNNSLIRVCIIYFFYSFLGCFGAEVVIVNTLHVYFSCLIMFLLIRKL